MSKTAGGGGSVYNQAAGALGGAGTLYNNAAGGYNPALGTASTAAAPGKIAAGIPGYMNPYINEVVGNTATDVSRMVADQQAVNNARASSMGAFGGSRAGIVEALTNSEGQKNIGDISAQLRQAGWNTAAGLAEQDVSNLMDINKFNAGQRQNASFANAGSQNTASQFLGGQQLAAAGGLAGLGTTGFNVGQQIAQQQGQQGALQQALMQKVMGLAGGQYNDFMGQPGNMLSMMISALGMNPLNKAVTQTSTSTPGLFDYLSLAAQTAGSYYGAQ